MKDIKLKYDDTIENWKLTFKENLEQMGIVYTDEMLFNMCSSLNNSLIIYLTKMGYRPNLSYSYRVGLTKRLSKHGLALSITTNRLFWKYLEYFTDLDNYSSCFNIDIEVVDKELATKDLIFVGVKTNQDRLEIRQPTHSEEYAEITQKLDIVKGLVGVCTEKQILQDIITDISDILDYIIRRLD